MNFQIPSQRCSGALGKIALIDLQASVFEKDLVFNYEVIKEVMMSIHGALPLVLPQGIPPLKDFEVSWL